MRITFNMAMSNMIPAPANQLYKRFKSQYHSNTTKMKVTDIPKTRKRFHQPQIYQR